jgi:hypothetical protein
MSARPIRPDELLDLARSLVPPKAPPGSRRPRPLAYQPGNAFTDPPYRSTWDLAQYTNWDPAQHTAPPLLP